jgi:hypothetical protein
MCSLGEVAEDPAALAVELERHLRALLAVEGHARVLEIVAGDVGLLGQQVGGEDAIGLLVALGDDLGARGQALGILRAQELLASAPRPSRS